MKNFKLLLICLGVLCMLPKFKAQSFVIPNKDVTFEKGNCYVQSSGSTEDLTLKGGILYIDGSDNYIVVKGFANKIIVEGSGNTVKIEKVNSIKIIGDNSHVFYKSRPKKGKKPILQINGIGSSARIMKK